MKRISLDGRWELQGTVHETMVGPAGEWIFATVPGGVHVDLMAIGTVANSMRFRKNVTQDVRNAKPYFHSKEQLKRAP